MASTNFQSFTIWHFKMKNILIFTLATVALFGCRKNTKTFDGPGIIDLYGDFKIMQAFAVNKDSVAFAASQTAVFSAKFNKITNWTITITGQTSKAQKVITGKSKDIDATNATWNGSTTNLPLFKNENCKAILKIENSTDSFVLPIKIISTKINSGLIIADFENGFDTKWTKFVQSGANMDFNIKADSITPQANKYLKMAGTVNWDWLIGLIDFNAKAYTSANTLPLTTNPDNVYFNCMIYGVPNTNQSRVLFQFKEDENADGTFNATNEDEYAYEILVNWEGWKLVSVKYADIITLVNGQPAVPKGNTLHNPDKISKISMLHLADPAVGFASCAIDYIIITDKPLQP
jgi:hypothetical protein